MVIPRATTFSSTMTMTTIMIRPKNKTKIKDMTAVTTTPMSRIVYAKDSQGPISTKEMVMVNTSTTMTRKILL